MARHPTKKFGPEILEALTRLQDRMTVAGDSNSLSRDRDEAERLVSNSLETVKAWRDTGSLGQLTDAGRQA